MTPVKFIEAVDSYFVYSTEALFTKVHEFIELFRNNNTVLGCLAVDTWQPGDTVSVGMIKRSPNMPAGVAAKATAGGETSTTEPTWPTTGTVSDGGVVWKMISQSGMETATQAEVTTGTDTEKAVTPATAAGCYLRIWQGTTAPTDLSGRTAWLNTNTDPAALYYYNTAKSAWQSAVAYAAGAGTANNANYVNNENISNYVKRSGGYDHKMTNSLYMAQTLQIRMAYEASGGYGCFLHCDGAGFYVLCTNLNDYWGSFNSLRPITVRLSDGLVTIGTAGLKLESGVILK